MTQHRLFVAGSLLGSAGAAVIIGALLLTSRILWILGFGMLGTGAVVGCLGYLHAATGRRSHILVYASVGWAFIFAAWIVIWMQNPSNPVAFAGTATLALGAIVLAYLWWKAERNRQSS